MAALDEGSILFGNHSHRVTAKDIRVDSNDFAIAVVPPMSYDIRNNQLEVGLQRIGIHVDGCTVSSYSLDMGHDGMARITIEAYLARPGQVPSQPVMAPKKAGFVAATAVQCEEIASILVEET